MKRILHTLGLLLVHGFAIAQNLVPEGAICKAYLSDGRTIRNIKPWKLHAMKMEYLHEGSLHDLELSRLDHLECSCGNYTVSDSGTLQKIVYDCIVLFTRDSIPCYITEIGSHWITYKLPGKSTPSVIDRMYVKTYLLKGVEDPGPEVISQVTEPADTVVEKPKPTPKKQPESGTFNDYQQGKQDAKRDFKGNGSVFGGFLCGMIPLVGWIVAPLTLAVPPRVSPSKPSLYKYNEEYRRGHKFGAQQKKARNTMGGFLGGTALLLILLIL